MLQPHESGQDKQLATFGKVHDMIILKIQAGYDNIIDIANSIRESYIVGINGMAPEHRISEEKYIRGNFPRYTFFLTIFIWA